MSKRVPRIPKTEMYEAILQLETLEECMDFFRDICAERELRSMEQRFEVARLLDQDMVYADISRQTNASTATISRVSRMLNDGTGMLEKSLKRMKQKEECR